MTDNEYKYLLDLTRALRLAQKGNFARGIRPDPETARRVEVAIDLFIAQHDDSAQTSGWRDEQADY